jgi:hypothetical protein
MVIAMVISNLTTARLRRVYSSSTSTQAIALENNKPSHIIQPKGGEVTISDSSNSIGLFFTTLFDTLSKFFQTLAASFSSAAAPASASKQPPISSPIVETSVPVKPVASPELVLPMPEQASKPLVETELTIPPSSVENLSPSENLFNLTKLELALSSQALAETLGDEREVQTTLLPF